MEICGVKFTDEKEYEAVKYAIDTLEMEGLKPTHDRVKGIKELVRGNITPSDIKKKYEFKDLHQTPKTRPFLPV